MPTFRRLNDGTRYYGLTWRGWLAAALAGGVLYLSVRFSPLSYKPTITLTLFAMAAAGVVLYAIGGQALGPSRYVMAIIRWRFGAARFIAPNEQHPVTGGVLVDAVPLVLADSTDELAWWQVEATDAAASNGAATSTHDTESTP